MRRLLLILLLPILAGAQTFSFWSYPRDEKADAKIEAVVLSALSHGYTKEPLRVPITYSYADVDSSFAVMDVQRQIFRVFVPDKSGVKELSRTVAVNVYEKANPKDEVKKTQSIGGDGILPKPQAIPEVPKHAKNAAETVAIVKLAAVNATMKDGKEWTEKASAKKLSEKEKRAAAWKIETGKAKPDDYTKTNKVKP